MLPMTTENASPATAAAAALPAVSAADAAVSLVMRTASADQIAEKARALRLRALMLVTLGVLFFLVRVGIMHAIGLWQLEEIVTRDSDFTVRKVDGNADLLRWLALGFGLASVVCVMLYAMLHVRIVGLHGQLTLTPDAAERRPRGAIWATIPAVLMAGIAVASQVLSAGVPTKPSPQEYYQQRNQMMQDLTRRGASLSDIYEQERLKAATVPWYIRAGGPTVVQRWYAVQLWLPMAFALMVLVLMVPVYSIQKLRIAADDVVPSSPSGS